MTQCNTCYGSGKIRIINKPPPTISIPGKITDVINMSVREETCPDCGGTGRGSSLWKTYGHSMPPPPQGLQLDVQDILNKVQQKMFDDFNKAIFNSTGLGDYMRGRRPIPKEDQEELDSEFIKLQHSFLKEMFYIDWSLPMTQGQQIALAFLQENHSEFIFGVTAPEVLFTREVNMRRWKGDVSKETAKVWLDENKAVVCARFPYKVEVIDEIRSKIPKGKKSWNPDDKVWEFSVEVIDVIVEILQGHFDEVIDLTQATPPPIPSMVSADPLLSLLDEEDIKRIKQMLVKRHHPDVGGNPDLMARINQVFNKK